jgi:hypothetical protein
LNTHRTFPSRYAVIGLAAFVAAIAPVLSGDQPLSREDAARLRAKVYAIARNAEPGLSAPLVTTLTEQEVNAYLAFDAREYLPAGLAAPRITVLPDLNLSGTATVDLDAVRQQRESGGWLDPLNYLGGKVSVAVIGRLTASGGLARFALGSARIGGVPVPKMVIQELVTFYTRTESTPRGLNIDDPYPLPARIRQIDVRPGAALVRQ